MSESMPDDRYILSEGRVLYRSLVREAARKAGFELKNSDRGVIVWYDDIKKRDFYGPMKPWQIVNRIPNINVLCRKCPFIRLIQNLSQREFKNDFYFLPKSFILPDQKEEFKKEMERPGRKFIVKPDRGSLGEGIKVIDTSGKIPEISDKLSVAQQYIDSYTINGYKFDFRIFVLIRCIDPLEIYIYRNGVARFCSKKHGEDTVYSFLTNKTINKKNPELKDLRDIVKMVKDVMSIIKEDGKDPDKIWREIDRAVVSTIISSHKFIKTGMRKQCPRMNDVQRCFQILGFDILLDKDAKPYVLEVNYRPSLEICTKEENEMKKIMLTETLKLVSPTEEYLRYVVDNYSIDLADRWNELARTDPVLKSAIIGTRNKERKSNYFDRIFPSPDRNLNEKYNRMLKYVENTKDVLTPKTHLPWLYTAPEIEEKIPEKIYMRKNVYGSPRKKSRSVLRKFVANSDGRKIDFGDNALSSTSKNENDIAIVKLSRRSDLRRR